MTDAKPSDTLPALDPVPFIFVRHGQTFANAEGRWQGHGDDANTFLTPTGEAQAQAAARILKARGVSLMVCSPLTRARQTAAFIRDATKAELHIDTDLKERGFGKLEGLTGPEIEAETGVDLETFEREFPKHLPPCAEHNTVLLGRAIPALNRWNRMALRRGTTLVVVGHGSKCRALREHVRNPARSRNGVPFLFTPNADGTWIIEELTER